MDGGLSYECGSGSSEGEGDEPGPRQRGVPLVRPLRETRPDRTPPGGGPSGLTRGHTPDGQCTGSQV